jgi:signal transduction histidine kinase
VSHELKTPLTAIRMFAGTLYGGGSPDDRTRSEYLDRDGIEQAILNLPANAMKYSGESRDNG